MSAEKPAAELLTVQTTRFGEISVPAEDVLNMPLGMVGFPGMRRFVLIRHRDNSPFQWLQSIDASDVAFVVVSPLLFDRQYNIKIGPAEMKLLELDDPENAQILVVVNIPHGQPEKMTANLRAPVVINAGNRLAAQIVMENSDYDMRAPLKKD